jgi:hypothetical protein
LGNQKFSKPKNLQFRVSEKHLNETSLGYGFLKKFKEPMGFTIELAKRAIRLGPRFFDLFYNPS